MDILLPTWLFLILLLCALAFSVIATIIALKAKSTSILATVMMIVISWAFPILGPVVIILACRKRETKALPA
jgi:hypothetical protein